MGMIDRWKGKCLPNKKHGKKRGREKKEMKEEKERGDIHVSFGEQ